MSDLQMPAPRDFGWALKPAASAFFDIVSKDNGQVCVVLHHALLRGCSAEMLAWWFTHFTALRVRLPDTPGYEGQVVPAYWLWHPTDHVAATLSGAVGANRRAQAGAKIHIQEAMQYPELGWTYPVDTKLRIFYCGADGWAMGKPVPLVGPAMMLRIHFRDVIRSGTIIGVQYHYEIVAGVNGQGVLARALNARITRAFSPDFFTAWRTHNVIEVGVFENFLPALYAQRGSGDILEYRRDMNPMPAGGPAQQGHDRQLFGRRMRGYAGADGPYEYQGYAAKSAL